MVKLLNKVRDRNHQQNTPKRPGIPGKQDISVKKNDFTDRTSSKVKALIKILCGNSSWKCECYNLQ